MEIIHTPRASEGFLPDQHAPARLSCGSTRQLSPDGGARPFLIERLQEPLTFQASSVPIEPQ